MIPVILTANEAQEKAGAYNSIKAFLERELPQINDKIKELSATGHYFCARNVTIMKEEEREILKETLETFGYKVEIDPNPVSCNMYMTIQW